MNKKRVAIIGCGALGSIIAAEIKERLTEDYIITGVIAKHYEKAEAAADKIGCEAFKTLELAVSGQPLRLLQGPTLLIHVPALLRLGV